MLSIIISLILGFVIGCWLSLSNLQDKFYEDYFELCKENRKMIFILMCSKSRNMIDRIIHLIMKDVHNVKEIWKKNKNHSKEEY